MILYVFQLLQLLVVAPFSFAQDPNIPKCTDSEFNWTFNSLGQSPCYVAELLTDPCTGLMYSFVPLPSTMSTYTATNDPCFCNTVVYSVLSACAICQNGSYSEWTTYSRFCNKTYFMEYPGHIPSNTSVPSWAYMNVTATAGAFDYNAAYYQAVVATTLSTSFTSTSTSTSLTSTSASTSTSALSTSISPSSRSSKTDARAIIGGAIGCAFGGALILALCWLYTKRGASRPDLETSPQTIEHKITDPPPSTGLSPVPSPPPLTDSPTPEQQAYQDALQNTSDPDDIPTSSTIPRFRKEGPRGLLPNTEHHWGQVGQYYADIPEL
ncbi:hypothetical protein F5887DRAFT_475785 [Amanita rubescens]|nr:hypothetical protein F5887DRAFT_475785 [Amanita rubescens]